VTGGNPGDEVPLHRVREIDSGTDRCRLFAGGEWIRTIGSAAISKEFLRAKREAECGAQTGTGLDDSTHAAASSIAWLGITRISSQPTN
jgi:hypothetical protein